MIRSIIVMSLGSFLSTVYWLHGNRKQDSLDHSQETETGTQYSTCAVH